MPRYAIYWLPASGDPVLTLCESWLGWSLAEARALPPPEAPPGVDWAAITAEPARYGAHATLKPPFRLGDGLTRAHLERALSDWAAARPSLPPERLIVARVGRFIALTPPEPSPALDRLAADAVREFDRFRAPAPPEELARRLRHDLDPVARSHLARWGYPYVFERFRFHVTLTGALDEPTAAKVAPWLADRFASALRAPVVNAGVALFEEPEPGARFRLLRRFTFGA